MATTNNCAACDEIKTIDPNFFVNGLGSSECASLKNDTGLSSSNSNKDCDDLELMNDCLVKNMQTEINSYNVCSWKDYMKALVGNLWTMFKGIICAICGIWTNVHNLWSKTNDIDDRIEDICALVNQTITPALHGYGTMPLADSDALRARRCGTVTSKAVKRPDDGTLNPYTKNVQNIGIAYAQMTVRSCTNPSSSEMLEWIAPSHHFYALDENISSGDILWKITKSEAQSVIGISDYLWQIFTESNWTWHESALTPSRQLAWMKITIGTDGLSSNELGLVYMGCTAPNNSFSADQNIATFNNSSARVYRHTVSS